MQWMFWLGQWPSSFENDVLHQDPCSIVHYQKDLIRDMIGDMVGTVDSSSTLPQARKNNWACIKKR